MTLPIIKRPLNETYLWIACLVQDVVELIVEEWENEEYGIGVGQTLG